MIPAIAAGLAGAKAFERKVDVAARNVANADTRISLSNVDLVEEITGMLEGQRGFELNLKTIQTGDEMLGALLDLKR